MSAEIQATKLYICIYIWFWKGKGSFEPSWHKVGFNEQFYINGSLHDTANNIEIRVMLRSSEKTQSKGVRFPFLVNLKDELNAKYFFRFWFAFVILII